MSFFIYLGHIINKGDNNMSLKKIKIIGVFAVFLLSFPLHFLYDVFPNFLTSIFASVNESIWEHMKIIFTAYLLYGGVEYLIFREKTKWNNFLLQLFIVPFLGIMIYLSIYLPLFNIFGENMIISIVLLFVVVAIEEVISYYILSMEEVKNQRIIGIVGIIAMYVIFTYLTYNPPKNYLFYDMKEEKYGIDIYV